MKLRNRNHGRITSGHVQLMHIVIYIAYLHFFADKN